MSRSLATAACALLLLALVGCTAPAPPGGGTDEPPAATGGFCSEFEANGGDGTTVGVVLTFGSKEQIIGDAQPRLDAMGDITPPDEIATEWADMKAWYTDLVAAAEALPDGANFNASPEYQSLATAPDGYEAVVDYYFENC